MNPKQQELLDLMRTLERYADTISIRALTGLVGDVLEFHGRTIVCQKAIKRLRKIAKKAERTNKHQPHKPITWTES